MIAALLSPLLLAVLAFFGVTVKRYMDLWIAHRAWRRRRLARAKQICGYAGIAVYPDDTYETIAARYQAHIRTEAARAKPHVVSASATNGSEDVRSTATSGRDDARSASDGTCEEFVTKGSREELPGG